MRPQISLLNRKEEDCSCRLLRLTFVLRSNQGIQPRKHRILNCISLQWKVSFIHLFPDLCPTQADPPASSASPPGLHRHFSTWQEPSQHLFLVSDHSNDPQWRLEVFTRPERIALIADVQHGSISWGSAAKSLVTGRLIWYSLPQS
jgi:hypothetical protein